MQLKFLGTGSALPKRVISNDELSKIMDTSDEWISTRTGIKNRNILTSETITEIAVEASKRALEQAGVLPQELDYIICTTVSGDYLTPAMSCIIQKELGAMCPSFDLNAACSGFLYALDTANAYLESDKADKILIVSAEAMSRMADWKDRSTSVLFGDGAGAVVVGKGDGLLSIELTASGDTEALYIRNVSGNCPFSEVEAKDNFLHMAGHDVYKFAVASICNDVVKVIEQAGVGPEDISFVVLHQANLRIIDTAQKKLGIDKDKFAVNIADNGNMSSASVPILLDELNRSGRLKKGQLIVLSAFGGGLTTGACVLRW